MKHQLTILVLGEVSRAVRGSIFQRQQLQSAPHYFEISVPNQIIVGEETFVLEGQKTTVILVVYCTKIRGLDTLKFELFFLTARFGVLGAMERKTGLRELFLSQKGQHCG